MLLGEITLDSRNIRSYRLRSLRGSIGMVQQDVYLFFDTFYENSPTEDPVPGERRWRKRRAQPVRMPLSGS